MKNPTTVPWRLIREPQVVAATGYSRATIRRLAKAGQFPLPVKLGPGPSGAIAWREHEVLDWVNSRVTGSAWAPEVENAR